MKRRMLSLAALAALLFAATAFAGRGGNQTPATMLFDNLLGDKIQSDGLGPYSGFIKNSDGSLVISTGERSLWIDLGGPDGLQPITGMTITVSSLDGTSATVDFESGTRDGGLAINMSVSVSRSGDTYYLESTSDAEIWGSYRERQTGRTSQKTGVLVWVLLGVVEMPWGAEVAG